MSELHIKLCKVLGDAVAFAQTYTDQCQMCASEEECQDGLCDSAREIIARHNCLQAKGSLAELVKVLWEAKNLLEDLVALKDFKETHGTYPEGKVAKEKVWGLAREALARIEKITGDNDDK